MALRVLLTPRRSRHFSRPRWEYNAGPAASIKKRRGPRYTRTGHFYPQATPTTTYPYLHPRRTEPNNMDAGLCPATTLHTLPLLLAPSRNFHNPNLVIQGFRRYNHQRQLRARAERRLVGGAVALSDLVREAAGIAALALALLERVAHAAAGAAGRHVAASGIVGEAARVAAVALTTLEGVAGAGGAAGGAVATAVAGSVSVGEAAVVATVALALLEGVASAGSATVGGEVGEGAAAVVVVVSVREAAAAATVAFAALESIAEASGLALESAAVSSITTRRIVRKPAGITAVALA
jgi:hypothetical protein